MIDESTIESAYATLQARVEELEAFALLVYEQTLSAQPALADKVCATLNRIASDKLAYRCPPDCQDWHGVARLARLEGVTRQTVYNWIKAGLEVQDGEVRHDKARLFHLTQI